MQAAVLPLILREKHAQLANRSIPEGPKFTLWQDCQPMERQMSYRGRKSSPRKAIDVSDTGR